jgi:hypothetical protein
MFETPSYKIGDVVYIIDADCRNDIRVIGTTITCIQVPASGKVKYCTEYGTYHCEDGLYPTFSLACIIAKRMYEKND